MNITDLIETVRAKKLEITADSRKVTPGSVFVAVQGCTVDGHKFIPTAIEKGASYIVATSPQGIPNHMLTLVESTSSALGLLAQAKYNNPAKKLINLAVTGTNGKTTVCFIVRHIINSANQKCGLIGTVEYDDASGNQPIEADMTTPDQLRIAELQNNMLNNSAKFMTVEASSHALSQNRLAGIPFTAAAFTNLTGDHLDYHENMENYLNAKAILFKDLSPESTAVLNAGIPETALLKQITKAKICTYAIDSKADITAWTNKMDTNGSTFTLEHNDIKAEVKSAMLGKHNIENQLAAVGLCLAAGLDLKTIANALSTFPAVPGRLEPVIAGQNFSILIDYAHTDDALKNVLQTLKPLTKNRLTVIFGCGGDRDKTKRPRMAKIAERLADNIIVTSDNPRTEDQIAIIEDIKAGFTKEMTKPITIEPDRETAIKHAIQTAQENDIILIAGKGHETYQTIGKTKLHFNDKEIALKYL